MPAPTPTTTSSCDHSLENPGLHSPAARSGRADRRHERTLSGARSRRARLASAPARIWRRSERTGTGRADIGLGGRCSGRSGGGVHRPTSRRCCRPCSSAARTPDGVSAHTLALQFGLTDIAQLLERAARRTRCPRRTPLSRPARAGMRMVQGAFQALRLDLPGTLPRAKLRLLPELAAERCRRPSRSWSGSDGRSISAAVTGVPPALNLAVFRGDAVLTRLLWRMARTGGRTGLWR